MVNMPVCFSRDLQTQTPQLQAQPEREPSAGARPVQLVASVEACLFAYLREVGSGCWQRRGTVTWRATYRFVRGRKRRYRSILCGSCRPEPTTLAVRAGRHSVCARSLAHHQASPGRASLLRRLWARLSGPVRTFVPMPHRCDHSCSPAAGLKRASTMNAERLFGSRNSRITSFL
jgi:hypothetical protein